MTKETKSMINDIATKSIRLTDAKLKKNNKWIKREDKATATNRFKVKLAKLSEEKLKELWANVMFGSLQC